MAQTAGYKEAATPENTQQDSKFLSLADELILAIIEQIDDLDALRSFISTCQKAQQLAEPYLYDTVLIRYQRQICAFIQAIASQPCRALHVHHLDIRCKAEHSFGLQRIEKVADELLNLRSWHIQSPCPNDSIPIRSSDQLASEIRYWKALPYMKRLESLSLHTHITAAKERTQNLGFDMFFDLTEGHGASVFTNQTLRQLHIACANILVSNTTNVDAFQGTTNLESLSFEECNIDACALEAILSKPKALKHLTLGERLYHHHVSHLPISMTDGNPKGLVKALARQAPTLQYLKQTQDTTRRTTYYNQFTPTEREEMCALPEQHPDYPMLEELDLPHGSPLCAIAGKRPPRLKKIRIHRTTYFIGMDPIGLFEKLPRELALYSQPSLEHFELVTFEMRSHRNDTEEQWLEFMLGDEEQNMWTNPRYRSRIWEFGRRLKKVGVRLTVNNIWSAGYIPPYMDGEILPVEFKAYDSDMPDIFGSFEKNKYIRDTECKALAIKEGWYEYEPGEAESMDLQEGIESLASNA